MVNRKKDKSLIQALHIIQGKHFGGAEQVVLTLVKCFDRKQVSPSVICLAQGLLLDKLSEENICNRLVLMRSKMDIIVPVLKIIRLIRKNNIDIIHTHTVRSNLIGRLAAILTGRKCITHVHSPILRDFADLRRGRLNETIDLITRPVTDRFITVSHSLRKEMIWRGLPIRKISTIHNAINLELFKNFKYIVKDTGNGIRGEYKIPMNAFVVVLVALLRPRKGIEVMIRAMKSILESFPELYLLIVGNDDISEDPGYGYRLRKLAIELGLESNIIFTGFRKDIPAILGQSNLLVLPSLFGEGLPMVILEAMAMGVPVVASNVEGVPEVIEDGINGFLVDPGNVKLLSEKMIKVLKNPIALLNVKQEAQCKIFNQMDGYQQSKKIEKIYKEVLAC